MFFGEFPVQPGRQIQSNHYYLLIIFFSTLERREKKFFLQVATAFPGLHLHIFLVFLVRNYHRGGEGGDGTSSAAGKRGSLSLWV